MYLAPLVLHNVLQLHVKEVSKLLNVFHSFLKGKKEVLLSRESCNVKTNFCSTKDTVANKITVVVSYGVADS